MHTLGFTQWRSTWHFLLLYLVCLLDLMISSNVLFLSYNCLYNVLYNFMALFLFCWFNFDDTRCFRFWSYICWYNVLEFDGSIMYDWTYRTNMTQLNFIRDWIWSFFLLGAKMGVNLIPSNLKMEVLIFFMNIVYLFFIFFMGTKLSKKNNVRT